MMSVWMVLRYLKDGRKYLGMTFVLSVLGVALSVAALIVAMAVVSGYETTLRESVSDIHGHLMILERGGMVRNRDESESKIQAEVPELEALTPFALVEGIVVHQGKMNGVLLEGLHAQTASMVVNLKRVLAEGEFDILKQEEDVLPKAAVGRGLFKNLNLKLGGELRLVIPMSGKTASEAFRSKVQRFRITGILDFGRQDYDERYVVSDLQTVQKFAELGDKISGWRVKLKSFKDAEAVAKRVENKLGHPFFARYWRESNKNLFDAIDYEKPIIFTIVGLMLLAAAFNIASTLFVSVVRRYQEISILKAVGASEKMIRRLFTAQGLLIGVVGSILGTGLGFLLCRVFEWAERKWQLFPGSVYILHYVRLEIRSTDVILILCVSTLICYLATLSPAKKGASLTPVEGLRYE